MLNANLNLMSRMGNWIDFPDYNDLELLEISSLLAKTYGNFLLRLSILSIKDLWT